jgi:tRNA(Ile)-lysidine synthase
MWDDPHNADPRFTRVRLRHEVLPLLEDVLASGVAEALARTAEQLREDGDALDAVAAGLLTDALRPAEHTDSGSHPSPAVCADPTRPASPADGTRAVGDGVGAARATAGRTEAGGGGADVADGAPSRAVARHAELDVAALNGVPPALRRRVLRAWLTAAGVTGLTEAHLRAADVLAARGPDRAGVAVPGGLELFRARGRLGIRPVRWPSAR